MIKSEAEMLAWVSKNPAPKPDHHAPPAFVQLHREWRGRRDCFKHSIVLDTIQKWLSINPKPEPIDYIQPSNYQVALETWVNLKALFEARLAEWLQTSPAQPQAQPQAQPDPPPPGWAVVEDFPWGQTMSTTEFDQAYEHAAANLFASMKKRRGKSILGSIQVTEKIKESDMKTTILFPYNNHTKGGKALAKALDIQFVKRDQMADYQEWANGKKVIAFNWGSYVLPELPFGSKVYNKITPVKECSNKISFFKRVKDKVRIPDFTTSVDEALKWVEDGKVVMGRTARGSCGKDIIFFEDDLAGFTASEFWVVYKKKKEEYRVHVAFGKVIAVQQKALRTTDPETGLPIDTKNVDYRIRNLASGFIFKRHDIQPPDDVLTQAANAIEAAGLDFGAVDVIYNQTEGKAYVLEINTAPGLEGTTVEDYANAFKAQLSA